MHFYKKILQLFTIIFVFINIVLSATSSSFESYYSFYYSDKKDMPFLSAVVSNIRQFEVFRVFQGYTGFNTGYGFYGPNVASEVITFFKVYDKDGKCIKSFESINFKSKEGAVRFNSISSTLLDKFQRKDKMDIRYADVLIKQIMKHVKIDYPKNYQIKCDLCLVGYPDIKAFNRGEVNDIFLIKSYTL